VSEGAMSQTGRFSRRTTQALAFAMAIVITAAAEGQDQLASVFTAANLAAYAYDPSTNAIYVTAYGNPAVVKVTGIGGSPSSALMVSETILQLYYRNNDPTRGVATPAQSGILLNPKPVGAAPAYSFALIADGGFTRFPSSGTVDPAATKKIYAYNLQAASITGDGTDVFTTRATLANLQAASGATSTSNTLGRQFAWSGDGQSIYFVDSSPAYGGLWKIGAVSGAPQRIVAADMTNTEPGVFSSGGVDRVYFSGVSGTAGVGNAGGIDYVTHDGTTTSGVQVAVSAARLADFFEQTISSQRISSVAFAGANMFFGVWNSNTDNGQRLQGIYQLDAEGRISKVANRTQRAAALGAVGQTFDRFQPREITYTGTAGAFPVTQLLYRESGANTVAGAIAFKPGDFNRDNALTPADIALFKPQVTSGSAANVKTNVADLTFDMNGNDIVDWKDVQILEQFLDYAAPASLAGRIVPTLPIQADADLNGVVDFADFRIMRDNYAPSTGDRTFLVGDFNGDDKVDFADLQPWVNSDGFRSAVVGGGVPATPFNQAEFNAFLATLTAPNIVLNVASGTSTQFQQGYRSIVIAASVAKTGGGTLVFDGANTYTGPTDVQQGTLQLATADALSSSAVTVAAGATLSVAPQVSAAVPTLVNNGLVDVGLGELTVVSGLTAEGLKAEIVAGRNEGAWDGATGIMSSAAAGMTDRAVGWIDNGDGSFRFGFAAAGDLDMNGLVDLDDVIAFVGGGLYDTGSPAVWAQGDYDYNGIVDLDDVIAFVGGGLYDKGPYNQPAGVLSLMGFGGGDDLGLMSGGFTAVPEPATWVLAALGAVCAAAWRRQAA
jgi:autotransporter-associated beta strand protein